MPLFPPKHPDALCDQQSHCLSCKTMACIHLGLYLYLVIKAKTDPLTCTLLTATRWASEITLLLPWAPLLGNVPPYGILLPPQRWLSVKSLLALMATFFFVLMPELDSKWLLYTVLSAVKRMRIREVTITASWMNRVAFKKKKKHPLVLLTDIQIKIILPGKYLDCLR